VAQWITTLVLTALLVYELWALFTHHPTISRLMWEAHKIFPMLPWIAGSAVHAFIALRYGWRALMLFAVGTITGGLAVHFWWHWCP
jgi:hypothetical protein